jgi:hypothetical protein
MSSSATDRRSRAAYRLELERVRVEAERRRREKLRRQAEPPIWTPNPGPQTLAVQSSADIIGYGGAAGGGKTDLMVGLALTEHRKAIVFRRVFPLLRDVITRAKVITEGRRIGFNANEHLLTLADGRTLEFGAMQHVHNWENYRGRTHDLKCYDEATEFTEIQVRSSMAWCRTTIPGQRCRVILAFNPPATSEGEWVVRFFAPWLVPTHPRPAVPGELRRYATVDGEDIEVESGEPFDHDGETIYPLSRTFFPARLKDNPYQDTPAYRAILNSLPEPLRSQLLHGDMEAAAEPNPWQVIPTRWVQAAQARWAAREPEVRLTAIGLDVAHGGKDQTTIARRYGNYVAEVAAYPGRETPTGAAAAELVVPHHEGDAPINVDAIGYGASAHERLADKPPGGYGLPARAINFAERSEFKDRSGRFKATNVRAEAFWRLREALDPEGGDDLALPSDPELLADLCAPTYRITPAGIRIEEKSEIRARIGRSPDKGESVILAMLPPPPRIDYRLYSLT